MSPTSNTFNAISICCRSNNSTTWVPSSSFLAKWLAILDSVLLLAIPMLTGTPIHFLTVFLICIALLKKLLSEYLFKIKKASSTE